MAVGDAHAEARVTDPRLDHLAPIADADDGLAHPLSREAAQLVDQEGLAGDLEQRLGNLARTGAQARAEPAREDAHGRQRQPQADSLA